MPRLVWNGSGTRYYETGIDRGVLYIGSNPGIAWAGLTSVVENPVGGEPRSFYLDGSKYLVASSSEEFEATISAYTYPDEFGACDGTVKVREGLYITQQKRIPFSFSYRTRIGNDQDGVEHGYKIHIVYNATAAPSQRTYSSIDDSAEPTDFSWDIVTRPPNIYTPTHVVVDSRTTDPLILELLENILYGSDTENSRLPAYDELLEIFDTIVRLTVTDNGDGTFTLVAPNTALIMLDETTFQLTWPSAIFIDEDSYNVSSL